MPLLDDLIELQKYEGLRINHLKQKDEINFVIKKINIKKNQQTNVLEELKKHIHTLSAELKDLELKIESIKYKFKINKELLFSGKISSPKEVIAKSQEIEIMKKNIVELEDKSLIIMETLDLKDKEKQEKIQELAQTDKELQEQETKLSSITFTHDETINVLRERLPPDFLKEFYNLIRDKGGQAVVHLKEGSYCGGCGVKIANKYQVLIKNKSIVKCESCHRFIYLPFKVENQKE